MNYVEIAINCEEPLKEILTAELCQLGYESFLETNEGLKAYRCLEDYDQDELQQLLAHYPQIEKFRSNEIPSENWNQQWESNFEPIVVGDCRIRAGFHEPSPNFTYDLIINPKMSFGTGHHETTRLMIASLRSLDLQNQSVLDVGCGTGILSILTEKLGADRITAVDNDPWAVENARENMQLNQCNDIEVLQGTVSSLQLPLGYHLVLANINRNVLLQEIPNYSSLLRHKGCLILSGFYTDDNQQIVNICETNGLLIKTQNEEKNWSCLIFVKN